MALFSKDTVDQQTQKKLDRAQNEIDSLQKSLRESKQDIISLEETIQENNLKNLQKETLLRTELANTVSSAINENTRLKIDIARLTEKVTMLEKVVDIAGEIVDVKGMIESIIKKLPEVNLSSLSVNVPNGGK